MPFSFDKVSEISLPKFLSNIFSFIQTTDFHQYLSMSLYITWKDAAACSFQWGLDHSMALSHPDSLLCLLHNGMQSQ